MTEADIRNNKKVQIAFMAGKIDHGAISGDFLDPFNILHSNIHSKWIEEPKDLS